jgi:hypothetical protein
MTSDPQAQLAVLLATTGLTQLDLAVLHWLGSRPDLRRDRADLAFAGPVVASLGARPLSRTPPAPSPSYRKNNKLALGSVGDSLDNLER